MKKFNSNINKMEYTIDKIKIWSKIIENMWLVEERINISGEKS
jgi:hypothetical protein